MYFLSTNLVDLIFERVLLFHILSEDRVIFLRTSKKALFQPQYPHNLL